MPRCCAKSLQHRGVLEQLWPIEACDEWKPSLAQCGLGRHVSVLSIKTHQYTVLRELESLAGLYDAVESSLQVDDAFPVAGREIAVHVNC